MLLALKTKKGALSQRVWEIFRTWKVKVHRQPLACAKSKEASLPPGPPEKIRAGYKVMIAVLLTSSVMTSLFGGFLDIIDCGFFIYFVYL